MEVAQEDSTTILRTSMSIVSERKVETDTRRVSSIVDNNTVEQKPGRKTNISV